VQKVTGHRERIGPLPHHRGEGAVELVGAANRDKQHLHAQRRCGSFPLVEVGGMRGIVGIPENGHTRRCRNGQFEKL